MPTEMPAENRSPNIDCPKYLPLPGSKRCRHYLDGGACSLASEFMCVEWLKRNRRVVPHDHPAQTSSPSVTESHVPMAPPAAPERDQRAPTVPAAPMPLAFESQPAGAITPRVAIPQDALDSFRALGVELCIRSEELGEVWLVPGYTGQARKEITHEHAATLRLLLEAFPGGRIAAFEKATLASRKEAQA
jgi:hypothetical protein